MSASQKAPRPPRSKAPRSAAIERPGCARIFDDTAASATRRKISGALHHDNLRDGESVALARRGQH